mgnify:CR=1 FL=1
MQLQQTKSSVEIASQWTKNNRLFAFPYTDFGVKNSFFEKAEFQLTFAVRLVCASAKLYEIESLSTVSMAVKSK